MFGLIFFTLVLLGFLVWMNQKKRTARNRVMPTNMEEILSTEVDYYRKLSTEEKERFKIEVRLFLQETRIEGIGTTIDDTDRLLIAASAIIPIFGFPEWHYRNLTDVLVYKDHFNESFQAEGTNRSLMGMV